MSDLGLGKIITTERQRDAIHIAVAPVVAQERLHPGQRVCADGRTWGSERVGIVDPFLDRTAMPGDRFWLFLFPNTVTSLRHEWTHPAFDGAGRSQAEKWLREYAARVNSYDTPEEGFSRLIEGLKSGHMVSHGTEEFSSLSNMGDDAPELRRHAEAYLGKRIDWEEFSFSCSC